MRSHPLQRFLTQRSWVCSSCRANRSIVSARFFSSQLALRADRRKSKREILPDTPARTRFAPSPTGYLHLGSLRTALFNYLLAKRTGGQFILRIEDTDQKRTIPGAEQRLCDDLQWAGLHWDEGPIVEGPYGPYQQSKRNDLYRHNVQDLVDNKHAYRCFCTPDRLDTLARHRNQAGLPPGYDRTCADIPEAQAEEKAANGESHVVRLRVDEAYPMFDDLVFGKTGQNRATGGVGSKSEHLGKVYDDPILLKSDGHPTYHLANVVDDHHMKITHVVRGTEWMSSTPMHMALYNAFNWEPPKFGHVPLLVEKSGQKLSKRNADIDIAFFKDKQGIFPETLVNFAALLGWSHSQKSDTFSLEELEKTFNLKLTKGNTIVAFEKLWFLQKSHAQRYASSGGPEFDTMVKQVSNVVEHNHSTTQLAPILQGRSLKEYISPLLRADAKSYTTAGEFLSRNQSFFASTLKYPQYTPAAAASKDSTPQTQSPDPALLSALHTTAAAFSLVPEAHWTAETHRANISSCASIPVSIPSPDPTTSSQNPAKAFKKELYHYLRWALSGSAPGPGIPETMEILGRMESVRRLKEAENITSDGMDISPHGSRRVKPAAEMEGKAWMGSLAGK